jgi:type II secretory pathway pseudopilin PulG
MKGNRSGATLVEVVIAASILAVVLLVFLSVMVSSSQMSATARETTIASSIIQSTSEDLFAMGYAQFWEKYFCDDASNTGIFYKIVNGGDVNNAPAYEKEDPAKQYWYDLPGTGRLRDESVRLFMLPSSDVASASKEWKSHGWVDFKLMVRWRDSKNKEREESIISRRSQ